MRRQLSINNIAKLQKSIDIYKYKKAKSILFHNRMLFFLYIYFFILIKIKSKNIHFHKRMFFLLQFNLLIKKLYLVCEIYADCLHI